MIEAPRRLIKKVPTPSSMPEACIIADGVAVAAAAFGTQVTPAFEKEVYDHMAGHRVIFAYDDREEPVGFTSYDVLERNGLGIVYIAGTVISPAFQHQGIATQLAIQALETTEQGMRVDFVAGRTQNPVVAKTRLHYCDPVYPITDIPTDKAVEAARMVHEHLQLEEPMDPLTLVTHNAYEHPLYKTRPRSGDAQIDGFFDRYVGPLDSVFIIGEPCRRA